MPDVREVYEMVTKQKSPAPGALERQQKRQIRAARNRQVGAFAVAAAIGITATLFVVSSRLEDRSVTLVDEPSPTTAPLTAPTVPFVVDLASGVETPLANSLVPESLPMVEPHYFGSPDGSAIAYSTCLGGGCSGSDTAAVAFVDGSGGRELAPEEGLNAYAPHWSPDGSRLVYLLRDGSSQQVGNLVVEDVATGDRTRITDLDLEIAEWWFLAPSFTLDGRDVVFHLPRSGEGETAWDVWSVPATGGEPILLIRDAQFPVATSRGIAVVDPAKDELGGPSLSLVTGDGYGVRRQLVRATTSIWWPTVSPDGNRIAYVDDGMVKVVDVRTGEVEEIVEGSIAGWLGERSLIVTP